MTKNWMRLQRVLKLAGGRNMLLAFCLLITAIYGCNDSSTNPPPEDVETEADFYIALTGNDANPGTIDQPWRTIGKAASTLSPGETALVRAGTYPERVIVQKSGSPGKLITIAAYPGETVTIDGAGLSLPEDWGGLVDISDRSYVRISGLRVINAGPDLNAVGILIDNSQHITIDHNYTYNTVSSGIAAWGCTNITIDSNEVELACNDGENECLTVAVTDTFVISHNEVHHSGPGSLGGEGIDAKDGSSNGEVFGNHVHDNQRLGIYVDAWDKHTFNIRIYNNLVHDNVGSDGLTLASESGGLLENVSVFNNVVYNNGLSGITISTNGESVLHPMRDIFIINNTFAGNGSEIWGGGITLENPDVENVILRNNICSDNVWYQIGIDPEISLQEVTVDYNLIDGYRDFEGELRGDNYQEGDPLFVNPSAGNFHLQSGSPAVDQGSNVDAPVGDFDGISRPQGNGIDIGAFEYQP